MRDQEVVLLDLLAAMADFAGEGPLGDAYWRLYQAIGLALLGDEELPDLDAESIREALRDLERASPIDYEIIGRLVEKQLALIHLGRVSRLQGY